MSDAAEAAADLLHVAGAADGEDASSPDSDALLGCMHACRAWLERAQVCGSHVCMFIFG